MGQLILTIISLLLIIFPGTLLADKIKFKNSRTVDAAECWEDGELIKCKQNGAIVGYQKNRH